MNVQSTHEAVVFVIDDDASVREGLKSLFESVGLHVELFPSGNDFLASQIPDVPSCLVLDVRLPGMSGIEFQQELMRINIRLPIVFVTGHGDIPMSVRAMKAGALEFLTKPCRDQDLLDAVSAALEWDRTRRKYEGSLSTLQRLFDSLSVREREVVKGVTAGRMNKQIAAELGVSEITVKVHRANAMRKMHARSLADLVKMTDRLDVPNPGPWRS